MQVHSLPRLVIQPSQTRYARLAAEIQFGRVLEAQHHRLTPHPLTGLLGMRVQNLPPIQGWIVQQSIGSFGLRPASTRQRNAPCRLRRQIVHQLDQPEVSPCIPQVQGLKLLLRPAHLNHPTTLKKFISYNKLQLWVNGWHEVAHVIEQIGLSLFDAPSLKAALDIDWGDAEQKQQALQRLCNELDALQTWIGEHVPVEVKQPPLAAAVATLHTLMVQD